MRSDFSAKKNAMSPIAKIGAILLFLLVLLVLFPSATQPKDYLDESWHERKQAEFQAYCDIGQNYYCEKLIKNCDNLKEDESKCSDEEEAQWEAYKNVKDCDEKDCDEEEEENWDEYKRQYILGDGSDVHLDSSNDLDPSNLNEKTDYKGTLTKEVFSALESSRIDIELNLGELKSWNGFEPKRVVLHHTGGSTLSSAVNAMKSRGLSVHYVVDKDGTIYQYVDLEKKAAHACGSNHETIGIEIVNSGLGEDYTSKQYESIEKIIETLKSRLSSIESPFVIGHFEVDKYYASNFNSRGCAKGKWDPSPNFAWSQIGYSRSGDDELASLCTIVKNDGNLNYGGDCYSSSTIS